MSSVQPRVQQRRMAIQHAACQLVVEKGYDGFTMDELAEAVGVSRRTLFNYVPDKPSAVLGLVDPHDHPAVTDFQEGGPTGALLPDLIHAVDSVMAEMDDPFHSVEHHVLCERAIAHDPKVAQLAMERFTELSNVLASLICQREEWPHGDLRSRAVSATFLALIKVSMDEFATRGAGVDFRTLFHEVLDADRAIRTLT